MPWKLVPPRKGKTLYYYIRGKYLGIRLDHSTGTNDAAAAKRILATWRKQAERGEFSQGRRAHETAPATFVNAATAYMRADGSGQYLAPILKAWKDRLAKDIDQIALDALAAELYPKGSPATRNRQVYTPVSAVLKHVGIDKEFRRPRGSQGNKSTSWLEADQAFALFDAADAIDPEFGLLCRFLLYTGMRLDEALSRRLRDLRIERAYIYLPNSKTGEPRGCHLPPRLVERFLAQPPRKAIPVVRDKHGHFLSGKPLEDAGVPFLERAPDAKLFRFHDGGAVREMLKAAQRAAGLLFPRRQGGFHLFCHTYGSWMHIYGKLDRHGLTRTNRWRDPDSADRYVHTQASEEARRADLLPTEPRGEVVEMKQRSA
jgi:integrase